MPKTKESKQEKLLEEAKKMKKAMESFTSQIDTVSKSLQPTLKAIESLKLNLIPSLKLMESWHEKFIPLFNQFDFRKLAREAKELNTPEYKKFIKEWGWLFNKKSVSLGRYCYGLYKKYGDKMLRNKISRWFYYKKNVYSILKDIKSKFPKRYHIIKEGFDFHLKKRYACSITLLLPHTEGILWDLGMKKKLVKQGYNSNKKYSRDIRSNKKDWDLHELSSKLFPQDKFHKIISNEIYCAGPRNKILHGRNVYRKKQREISRWRSTLLILTLWKLSDEFR